MLSTSILVLLRLAASQSPENPANAEECFIPEKDFGTNADLSDAPANSYWDCYALCRDLKTQGCTHFTYMDSLKTCFMKSTGIPFTEYSWGTMTAELACFDQFETLGEAPSEEPPYTAELCFETNAVFDATSKLPESQYFPVLGGGFSDPNWCQLNCNAVPECNFWQYIFWAGKYGSEAAQDVDRAACDLFAERVATPLALGNTATYTSGPKTCPGGSSNQKAPVIDKEALERGDTITLMINAGGPERSGHAGSWSKDSFYTTGRPHTYYAENYFVFAGMDPLAQTNRYNFEYAIPIPVEEEVEVNAKIKLYFVEHEFDYNGARSFGVTVEGEEVVGGIDPLRYATALMTKNEEYDALIEGGWSVFAQSQRAFGTMIELDLPLQVVKDGVLNIGHINEIGDSSVSLLEILLNIPQQPRASISITSNLIPVPIAGAAFEFTATITNTDPEKSVDLSEIKIHSLEPGSEIPTSESTLVTQFAKECVISVTLEEIPPAGTADLMIKCTGNNWISEEFKEAFTKNGDSTGSALLIEAAHLNFLPLYPVTSNDKIALTPNLNATDFGFTPPVSSGNAKASSVQFINTSTTDKITINSISLISTTMAADGVSGISIYQKDFGTIGSTTGTLLPYDAAVELEPGEIFGIRITYAPDSVGNSYATVIVNTDIGSAGHFIVGQCVDINEPHFLHPVITLDPHYIDYSGEGKMKVVLDGSYSHTHEPYRSVVSYEWLLDGAVLPEKTEAPEVEVEVGKHSIMLTIIDDIGKRLNAVTEITVKTPDEVGGAIVFLYDADTPVDVANTAGPINTYTLGGRNPVWVNRSSSFGYKVDPLSLNVANSPSTSKNAVSRVIASWDVEKRFRRGDLKICSIADVPVLFLNGNLMTFNDKCFSIPLATVEAAQLVLDARWPILNTDPAEQYLCVMEAENCVKLDIAENIELYHDETEYLPFAATVDEKYVDISGEGELEVFGYFIESIEGLAIKFQRGSTSPAISVIPGVSATFALPTGQTEGVQTLLLTLEEVEGSRSSSAKVQFMDGAPPPIAFGETYVFGDEETGVAFPTQIDFGHDGFIYVVDFDGQLVQYEVDTENRPIAETRKVFDQIRKDFPNNHLSGVTLGHTNVGSAGVGPNSILGFAIDPFSDPKAPHIYIASAPMFAQGGSCFDFAGVHAGFESRIDRLIGPDYTTRETILTGMGISNHDHGTNGMNIDNEGRMYFLQGVQTNSGWPTCILGGLPESHYMGALNRIDLRKSWHRNIEYIDYATGEWDYFPNQVIGDMLAPAPWMTGIETFASGLRNCFDFVMTTQGRYFVTQNGFNEGYGEIVDGEPDCEYFSTWDEIMGGTKNPYNLHTCIPPVRGEFSEPDRLFETFQGAWHGIPNPPFARNTGKKEYWTAKDAFAPNDPPNFYQGVAVVPSLVGITEWKGNCFKGVMRGDLIMQKWNGEVWRTIIPDEQRPLQTSDISTILTTFNGVDVQYGPGCTILGADFTGSRLLWSEATEPNLNPTTPEVFDILPWRGTGRFEYPVRISGRNFEAKGVPTKITVSGVETKDIKVLSDKVITATTLVNTNNQAKLGRVEITYHDGTTVAIEDAFLWRNVPAPFDQENPDQMPDRVIDVDTAYAPIGPADPEGLLNCGIRNADLVSLTEPIQEADAESEESCQALCASTTDCNTYRHVRTIAISPAGVCSLFPSFFATLVANRELVPLWKSEVGPKICKRVSTTTTSTSTSTSSQLNNSPSKSEINTTKTDEAGNIITTPTDQVRSTGNTGPIQNNDGNATEEGNETEQITSISSSQNTTDSSPLADLSIGGIAGVTVGAISALGLVLGGTAAIVIKKKKSMAPAVEPRDFDSMGSDSTTRVNEEAELGPTPRRPFNTEN